MDVVVDYDYLKYALYVFALLSKDGPSCDLSHRSVRLTIKIFPEYVFWVHSLSNS